MLQNVGAFWEHSVFVNKYTDSLYRYVMTHTHFVAVQTVLNECGLTLWKYVQVLRTPITVEYL